MRRQGEILGGAYRLERSLKDRGHARTWLATDVKTGGAVVVKQVTAGAVSEGARLQTRHEAEIIGRLTSPYIPRLHHLGDDGDDFVLVREWVEGESLEGTRPVPWHEAARIGICLAGALEEAHAHGVLHRDVKPANVIRTRTGASLIDFGLAFSPHAHPALGGAAGTRLYMSPEQAGLLRDEVGPTSDLYSLGLVLAEAVSGTPLVEARSLGEGLHRMATASPSLPGAPHAFGQIVEMLLRRSPRDRYQGAAAVAADLAALLSGDPARVVIGAANVRRTLAQPLFLGRSAELEALVTAVRQESRAAIEGPSGIGKSRLLDETMRRVHRELRVLRGQATHDSTTHPLQVLDGILLELLTECRADEALRARLERLPGHVREILGQVAPRLAELLGARGHGRVPDFSANELTLDCLRALLEATHCDARALVVVVDDAQWADPTTLALFERLRGPRVLVSFRSEEVDDAHPLRQVAWSPHVRLGPLSERDRLRVVASMTGRLPAEVAATVAEASQGSPLWIAEVLRGLEETGALRPTPTGWECQRDFESLPVSRRAAALLTRRLDALPAALSEMLRVAAQLGKTFSISLLEALVPHELDPLLAEAVTRYLLWVDRGAGRAGFTHDRLREALQARLDEAPRQALHARAAEVLARRADVAPHDLAFHYTEAGDAERAFPHVLAAARDAWARLDFELAEAHFRQARASASTLEIHEGLGAVLMARARYDEADRELQAGLAHATSPPQRARLHLALSKVQNGSSNWAAALAWLKEGLRDLGLHSDRHPALRVAREVAVRGLQNLLPREAWRAREELPDELLRLTGKLLHHCYQMAANLSDLGTILWADFALLNTLEAQPPCPELAFGWAAHTAVVRLLLNNPRGALTCGMRALQLAQRFPEEGYVNGLVLTRLAWLLLTLGELRPAPWLLEEALALLRPSGDQMEISPALYHVALASYNVGDHRRCREAATEALQRSLPVNFRWVTASSAVLLAAVSGGRLSGDLLEAATDCTTAERSVRGYSCGAWSLVRLAEGRTDEAARMAGLLLGATEGNVNGFQVADCCQWAATILRVCAERTGDRGLARLARRAVETGLKHAGGNPSTRPRLLREHALLSAASRRPLLARRLLAESLRAARALGMPVEEALTLYHGGERREALRIFRQLGLDPSALSEIGLVRLHEPEEADTWALVDRMEGVVDAAAALCAAPDRDEMMAALQAQAQRLLPGRACSVVERGEDALTRTLVARAEQRGRAVLTAEGDAPSDSQLIHEVRSALCCPVRVDGHTTAYLLAVDTEAERGIGTEEAEIADLICTVAAAALENIAMESALERVAETLQQQSDELERARDAQAALLSELHHQVKNNFQVMLSLISLRPEAAGTLEKRVRALAAAEPELPAVEFSPPPPVEAQSAVGARSAQPSPGRRGDSLVARFSRLLGSARAILRCSSVQEILATLVPAVEACTSATCVIVSAGEAPPTGEVDASMRVVEVRTVAQATLLARRDPFRDHDARVLDFLTGVADLTAAHARRVEALESRTRRLRALNAEVQAAITANEASLAALELRVDEQLTQMVDLTRETPLARHAVAMQRSRQGSELVAYLREVFPGVEVRGASVTLEARRLAYAGLIASELEGARAFEVSEGDGRVSIEIVGPFPDLGLVAVLATYLKADVERDEAGLRLSFPA